MKIYTRKSIRRRSYKIYTLGCKVNQYDSGKLAGELVRAGFIMADKNADLAIINSCAVTKTAMIKSGRMVKLAGKENPKAKIALAGCWPRVDDKIIKLEGVDLVLKANEVKVIVEKIKKLSFDNGRIREIASPANAEPAMTNKSRYFIKVQDGCEQFCSYCIIPYARGKLKSRGEREVVNEIKQAVKAGYQEIVLSGIHLGLYGKESSLSLRAIDFSVIPAPEPESRVQPLEQVSGLRVRPAMTNFNCAPRNDNLVSLIKKIIKIKNLGRLRLSSIEITEVTDKLINLMSKSDKICKHLHAPLQSGSDKILKLMNRPYNIKYFAGRIKRIRRAMPAIAITTDVIVGFPGETEKDFRETEKFIKLMKFSRLHVFPFSAHEKTPAAKLPNQIEEKIKARRAKILRKLGIKLAEDYKNKFKGRNLEVAIEQVKRDRLIGKTEYYFDIEFDKKQIIGRKAGADNSLIGRIIKIKNN
ncbi:radical SAM protein [Candidatus Falkowbacteria bacterium]|nr:radical SAM protein [Candidatus Falkowbacteria bacterium]